jgi:hypothetical protein
VVIIPRPTGSAARIPGEAFIFATGKPWKPVAIGFSRLYRGSWPQGEMRWTVGLLSIRNLFSDQVQRITGADHGLENFRDSLYP